ncbi:MAG: glycosyltransferase family 2 protein [Dehalococcoidia bacterium]
MITEVRRTRVSIGLPVYNGERYIRQALDSVLAQTFAEYELVISDNASTDETEMICREYAERDERVRYFRNRENLGAAANYNRAFRLSNGEYFKWLAADDVLHRHFLQRCVEALGAHPDAVLAYPRARCIDEHGNMFLDADDGGHMHWQPRASDRFRQLLDESPWRVLFIFGLIRADALAATRLIGNFLGSDCNLVAELALRGSFHEVSERLSFIRLHPDSSSWHQQRTRERAYFFDPRIRGRLALAVSRQRRYFEYFRSILRSDLPAAQKLALVAHNAFRPLRRLPRLPRPRRDAEEREAA